MIAKGESCAVAWPSLTLITMFPKVPTFAPAGVPRSRPVLVLNVAQLGRFVML